MKSAEEWFRLWMDSESGELSEIGLIRAIQEDAAPQWQPIDTAPKDGTDLIVLERAEVKMAKCFAPPLGSGDWLGEEGYLFSTPTHWMPLPKPPKKGTSHE